MLLSLGLFLVGVDNSVLYTTLPTLRAELDASELEALWIINAYPLVLAGFLLGTGTLGDKIGHRRMFTAGLVIFGVASLAAAFAPSAWALVAARAPLGLGAATLMPATLALVRQTFHDPKELSTAIGVWASVALLGAAAGPVIGGALLEHFWWGSVFLINVPVVLVSLIALPALAPPNEPHPDKHWDFVSSLHALVAMFGLVMFIKEISAGRSPLVLALSAAALLIGATAFVLRQRRLPDPLLTFDVFRDRLFTGGVLTAGLGMFVLAGAELLTTQRFQLSAGFSPLEAGLLTAAGALASFPTSVAGGALLHVDHRRLPRRRTRRRRRVRGCGRRYARAGHRRHGGRRGGHRRGVRCGLHRHRRLRAPASGRDGRRRGRGLLRVRDLALGHRRGQSDHHALRPAGPRFGELRRHRLRRQLSCGHGRADRRRRSGGGSDCHPVPREP